MKNTIILAAILILTMRAASGQTNKFDIGAEGGPSLIFMRGNEMLEKYNDASIGFTGGVCFQYNFYKMLSLRTNLSFERKGCWAKFNLTDELGQVIGEATYQSNFDYITLPILLRATFGKKLQFFINTGAYFGFLITLTNVTTLDGEPYMKWNNASRMKRFDTGISSGIGLIIPVKQKFALSVEARNNMGLFNISAVPVYNDGSILTNSTNLLFGFTYKFGFRNN